jgi:pyridoxamine 5'-phosphate oxidase
MNSLSGNPFLADPGFDRAPENPMNLLQQWLNTANQLNLSEPKGMVLSTVDHEHKPSSRVVLLKDCDVDGVTFGSSQKSAKGNHLITNPWASANLWWRETVQQIIIQGRVSILSDESSDQMFQSRTREAQAVAAISEQSAEMLNEAELRDRVLKLVQSNETIIRPKYWYAYHLKAEMVEFWHGGKDRFHKRLRYDLVNETWQRRRLQP